MKYLIRCVNCGHEWEYKESNDANDLFVVVSKEPIDFICPECGYANDPHAIIVDYE